MTIQQTTMRATLAALVVTASPASVDGFASGTAVNRSVTSSATTASVTGNVGAVSYSWARVSGDTRLNANSPSAASTTFTAALTASAGTVDSASAVFRVTATDAATGFTSTFDVSVYVEYTNTSA